MLAHPLDQLIEFVARRQLVGEHGRRKARFVWRIAHREHRQHAGHRIGKFELQMEKTHLLELFGRKQPGALDDHQNVILACREEPAQLGVVAIFGRIGAEKLAQGIISLEQGHAIDAPGREPKEHHKREKRRAQHQKSQPLEAESE